MLFDEFRTYIDNQEQDVLKFVPTVEKEEDGEFHVTKSKVVYGFWCEDGADEEPDISSAANDWLDKMHATVSKEGLDFKGAIKFKKGKENKKTEEVTRYGCYEVTIEVTWEK